MNPRLLVLAQVFGGLSLVAIGGATPVLPDMERQFVHLRGWLDGPSFAALVALAQAAPGPNAMVAGLIGWRTAGAAGAAVATLGMCGPSSVLAIAAARGWSRLRKGRLGSALERGLAPITVGLVLAGGAALARALGAAPALLAITAASTLAALRFPNSATWLLAGSALLGALS